MFRIGKYNDLFEHALIFTIDGYTQIEYNFNTRFFKAYIVAIFIFYSFQSYLSRLLFSLFQNFVRLIDNERIPVP